MGLVKNISILRVSCLLGWSCHPVQTDTAGAKAYEEHLWRFCFLNIISTVPLFCSLLSAWNVAAMPRGEAAILQPGGRELYIKDRRKEKHKRGYGFGWLSWTASPVLNCIYPDFVFQRKNWILSVVKSLKSGFYIRQIQSWNTVLQG